jgi:hypothetical protein
MMDTLNGGSPAFSTVAELVAWLSRAPTGTHLEAREVARILSTVEADDAAGDAPPPISISDTWTWRERLWLVPAETRLGVVEVAEALDRPRSFIYARTGAKAEDPIPHAKLDGTLVFRAGEVRAWIREREVEVHAGPTHSTDDERQNRGLYAV